MDACPSEESLPESFRTMILSSSTNWHSCNTIAYIGTSVIVTCFAVMIMAGANSLKCNVSVNQGHIIKQFFSDLLLL